MGGDVTNGHMPPRGFAWAGEPGGNVTNGHITPAPMVEEPRDLSGVSPLGTRPEFEAPRTDAPIEYPPHRCVVGPCFRLPCWPPW
jgi:hypothetical protein